VASRGSSGLVRVGDELSGAEPVDRQKKRGRFQVLDECLKG
jgi:hypothetical protein